MALLDRIFGRAETSNVQRSTSNVELQAKAAVVEANPLAPGAELKAIINPSARDRWSAATLKNLTPERVEQILRSAIAGSFIAQWELFDLMEDTWPRLKKNLNELKRAVEMVGMVPVAYGSEKKASPMAERKKDVLYAAMMSMQPRKVADENSWERGLYDMCDAVGKGISVQEILWEVRDLPTLGQVILPRAFQWVYPRHYGYDSQNPDLLLSPRGDGSDFIAFPEDKFVIATFKTKTGHLLTSAMLRALATFWIGANFAYDWALNLAQIFGLPIRWATYDPSNPKLLDEICDMLENMGSAGWGAFPAGTTLELKEAVKDAANNPQTFLMSLADITADILILGQTLTTSQGDRGSQALGKVHNDVRAEVIEYVATWAAEEHNYEFVPALMRLNFGHNDEDPYLVPDIKQQKDKLQMAQTAKILFQEMGVPIGRRYIYDEFDLPEPGPDDDLLELAKPEETNQESRKAGNGEKATARLAVHAKRTATDELVDNVLESLTGIQAKWLGDVKPFFQQLVELAEQKDANGDFAISDERLIQTITEAAEIMPELFAKLKTDELADALNASMTAGLVNGVSRGVQRRRIAA